eukprot:4456367-Amphidinium_carterae.1
MGTSSQTISRWISFKAQGSTVLWPGRELLLPGVIGGWIGLNSCLGWPPPKFGLGGGHRIQA